MQLPELSTGFGGEAALGFGCDTFGKSSSAQISSSLSVPSLSLSNPYLESIWLS